MNDYAPKPQITPAATVPARSVISVHGEAENYPITKRTQGLRLPYTRQEELSKSDFFQRSQEIDFQNWSHPPGSNRRPADYES
jgi:hypothetical protein